MTRATVVSAAIAIGDAEGLAATTLRAVAERLEVSVAGLYRYVSSKTELVALMVEQVLSEARLMPTDPGWRQQLEDLALADWERYHRHPWLLDVPMGQVPRGPSTVARFDAGLRAALQAGFPAKAAVTVVNAIDHLVLGAARDSLENLAFARASGMDAIQWWQMHGKVAIDERLTAGEFPSLGHTIAAGGFDHTGQDRAGHESFRDQFREALNLLLEGIDAAFAQD